VLSRAAAAGGLGLWSRQPGGCRGRALAERQQLLYCGVVAACIVPDSGVGARIGCQREHGLILRVEAQFYPGEVELAAKVYVAECEELVHVPVLISCVCASSSGRSRERRAAGADRREETVHVLTVGGQSVTTTAWAS